MKQQDHEVGWILVGKVRDGSLDLSFQGHFRLSLLVTFLGLLTLLLIGLL